MALYFHIDPVNMYLKGIVESCFETILSAFGGSVDRANNILGDRISHAVITGFTKAKIEKKENQKEEYFKFV